MQLSIGNGFSYKIHVNSISLERLDERNQEFFFRAVCVPIAKSSSNILTAPPRCGALCCDKSPMSIFSLRLWKLNFWYFKMFLSKNSSSTLLDFSFSIEWCIIFWTSAIFSYKFLHFVLRWKIKTTFYQVFFPKNDDLL